MNQLMHGLLDQSKYQLSIHSFIHSNIQASQLKIFQIYEQNGEAVPMGRRLT